MSEKSGATTLNPSILCAAASRASPPVSQANERDRPMSDGFGLLFCEWCGSCGPHGCWRRTLAASLASSLTACLGSSTSWKPLVMRSQYILWAPVTSERRIDGSECGSLEGWPTPRAEEAGDYTYCNGDHDKPFLTLTGQVKQWPTPQANDDKGLGPNTPGHSPQLRHMPEELAAGASTMPQLPANSEANSTREQPNTDPASDWQTPQACQSIGGHRSRGGKRANELLLAGQAVQASGNMSGRGRGSLNSAWVSQLMGYPDGWLDLPTEVLSGLLETQSSRKSRK